MSAQQEVTIIILTCGFAAGWMVAALMFSGLHAYCSRRKTKPSRYTPSHGARSSSSSSRTSSYDGVHAVGGGDDGGSGHSSSDCGSDGGCGGGDGGGGGD